VGKDGTLILGYGGISDKFAFFRIFYYIVFILFYTEKPMIRSIDHTKMGHANHGWLDSHFHFSFADYYNPDNMNFGVLRVLNDDIIQSGPGFGAHSHANMEILSYMVSGELTHGDSMGNEQTLTRGQVQYMSAGTGVEHDEFNPGKEPLRLLQIWIVPDKQGYTPSYGDFPFKMEDRMGKWLPVASWVNNTASQAPIKIHQDVNMYAAVIPTGKSLDFEVASNRQAYMVQIEGASTVEGKAGGTSHLAMRDAAEIVEENFTVNAHENTHLLIIEMAKQ
jgi:redox-sensitive bicupin YhaK (pirin superfamily)